jgi:hypothetical protein
LWTIKFVIPEYDLLNNIYKQIMEAKF